MDIETKQRIIEFNRKLGIKTEFITAEESVLGYAQNNTIYINENVEQDYEKTNKHEVLHFFEDTPEFAKLKKTILESVEKYLDQIRAEYELRYFGIYSEDEIQAGVIDNEIVIDLLVNNSIIEYENGLIVGDRFLGDIEHGLEERRYLNMSIRRNVQNMNLSDWEKIFVENFYDGKEHILPQANKLKGIKREDAIRQDIEKYLEELYTMTKEDFIIDPYSPEVIREYESEIKALQARGENTEYLEYDKEEVLEELANRHSEQLYAEYKHIVDQIKGMEFEPAFKALMLRETLTKIYKLEIDDKDKKTIIKKRNLHKSIAGHMVLNNETLDFIYQHPNSLQEYQNFANLYFAALEVYNKSTAKKSGISLEGVDTYEMGKWIKFEGKESNEEEYLKNAERLAALVKDTPWCTSYLASSQLADGDFYVFVDNEGSPHIAVRMAGNQIAEVRGIQNGDEQALEEEYRDVAISFLKNNKEIKHGVEWLESEEWNKRLIEYKRKIENGIFSKKDVPILIEDLYRKGYMEHSGENQNKTNLIKILNENEIAKSLIADYYGCSKNEVFIGNYHFPEDLNRNEYEEDEQNNSVNGRNVAFKKYKIYPVIIIGDIYFDYETEEEALDIIEDIMILTGTSYGLGYLIQKTEDSEYIKNCIERNQELGLYSDDVYYLIKEIQDLEFIKSCIEKGRVLRLKSYQIYDLIEETKDPEYMKSCIERREELGLNINDVYYLIRSTKDPEYIKSCIERREELELNENEIYNLIWRTKDPEYMKSCIERREELGLNANKLYDLIREIQDPEYTKSCIERREELGLNANELYDLILTVKDPEYIKSCIERREELGLKTYQIYDLILRIQDPECKKIGIERREELGLNAYEIYDLIWRTRDPEYIKSCIERREELGLKTHQIYNLIKEIKDSEYIKSCIERSQELGFESYQVYDLIEEIKDPEYIKSCIERREELGLESYQVRSLMQRIKNLEHIKSSKKRKKEPGLTPKELAEASEQTGEFESQLRDEESLEKNDKPAK